MNSSLTTAAVVLAAGTSSRMAACKPLLCLGSASVIERVVRSVRQGGVEEILIVTGHRAEDLAPALSVLGVRQVHNAGYEAGMFSSVRTGAGALGNDVDAFFVLPVDYALVRPQVLDCLLRSYREVGGGILHPTCCGRRGHPPLISGRFREELSLASETGDLRSFLRSHAGEERDVEVQDLTILMDMDTPEEYRRLQRFVELTEGAKEDVQACRASLDSEDALYLLSLLSVPDRLVRHCQTVAAVGVALAEALKARVPTLDVDVLRSACLLHDVARCQHNHAAVGQRLLESVGLHRLGSLVGSHMTVPAKMLGGAGLTEEQLVYLADKLVIEDRVVGLEERAAAALGRYGEEGAASSGVEARMQAARLIRDKAEAILGGPLSDVLTALPRW